MRNPHSAAWLEGHETSNGLDESPALQGPPPGPGRPARPSCCRGAGRPVEVAGSVWPPGEVVVPMPRPPPSLSSQEGEVASGPSPPSVCGKSAEAEYNSTSLILVRSPSITVLKVSRTFRSTYTQA